MRAHSPRHSIEPLTTSPDVLAFIRRTFSLDGETVLRNGVPLKRHKKSGTADYAKVHIRVVNSRKVTWKLSRLKLFLSTGELPEVVDHKSGDTRDDSLENLRPANRQLNAWNSRRKRNNSGLPRNVKRKGNRFAAYITMAGKRRHLGSFETEAEAAKVAEAESAKLRGEFHRYRRKLAAPSGPRRTPRIHSIPLNTKR